MTGFMQAALEQLAEVAIVRDCRPVSSLLTLPEANLASIVICTDVALTCLLGGGYKNLIMKA
jgi:hypothetical protein